MFKQHGEMFNKFADGIINNLVLITSKNIAHILSW